MTAPSPAGPPVPSAAGPPLSSIGPRSGEYGRLAKRVRILSWLSLGWMTLEGAIAITAGITAGSIALIGFGRSGRSTRRSCGQREAACSGEA